MPTEDAVAVVRAFNEAFGLHDLDGVMATMTADCLFEHAAPAPDGLRNIGQEEVRAFFAEHFARHRDAVFRTDELIVAGQNVIELWTRIAPSPLSGIDVYRIRDGKIAEARSYSKRAAD